MKRYWIIFAVAMAFLVGTFSSGTLTSAAPADQGKPFEALQQQIDELQFQIDSFFDVFYRIELGEQNAQNIETIQTEIIDLQLHSEEPIHLSNLPQGCNPGDFVTGIDENGNVLCGPDQAGSALSCENQQAIKDVIPEFEVSPECVPPFVLINEVFYDGPFGDSDDAFTELFGSPGLDLTGYELVGINGFNGEVYRTIPLTGTIPEDGFFVIATDQVTGTTLAERDLIANVDWQNGADAVQLKDPAGAIVDALQYGDAGANNAGEGTPAPDPSGGEGSLTRDAAHTDTDDNASDFTVNSPPTPGS